MEKTNPRKGFTIIELLVVISIVSLLSSVLIVSANAAKAKGRDAAKIATSKQVATALTAAAYDNKVPGNYAGTSGNYIAFEDQVHPNGSDTTASGQAYNRSMQELVDGHYLSAIPRSTGGQPYAYYNYGPGTPGAMFGTGLEQGVATPTGLSGSCRPIPATSNFNPSADFNHDSHIDGADYTIWADNFGQSGDQSHGDANNDGLVNDTDKGILMSAWNTSSNDLGYHNFCSQNITTDYCVCANY